MVYLHLNAKTTEAPRDSGDAKAAAPAVPEAAAEGESPAAVHGEPSYALGNGDVSLHVTRRAGHMAPVRFRIGKRWVEPYALAPWQPHEIDQSLPPILRVLRGDYFCLPFGSSKGVKDVHGETANGTWDLVANGAGRMILEMDVQSPKCRVRKTLSLKAGHRAVYQEHRIEGLQGRYNLGHHAILEFPEKGGPYHVNTSPFRFGSVKPDPFSDPLAREYGALKTGARFSSLAKVPLANGGTTSLQRYPARKGFEDLVLMASRPGDFAWTAATLDGYVWISLKDPRTLPSTLFWISNGGRHAPPWNGTHLRRLGLEEVCGHFSDGLEASRKNLLRAHGVPTTLAFKSKEPKSIRLIHLVHPVPRKFGMVTAVEKGASGTEITVTGSDGQTVNVPVDWVFLHGKPWKRQVKISEQPIDESDTGKIASEVVLDTLDRLVPGGQEHRGTKA
jgi:hypothetical protein